MFATSGAHRMSNMGRMLAASAAAVALTVMPSQNAAAAETRTLVVSWFYQATYSKDGDCPNGELSFQALMDNYRRELKGLNFSKAELDDYIENVDANRGKRPEVADHRVKVDGKLVNTYANPVAQPLDGSANTPKLPLLKSQYAFGFNLDGKGTAAANGFEDPETHEKGVNNELYRAMGCITSYRAMPPTRSLSGWGYQWQQVRDSMPAWIITVSGDSLTKDGPVTVTFDRALERADVDAKGDVRTQATFRLDPSQRSHNAFKGQLKSGVITVEPVDFHMLGDPYLVPEFKLRNAHMRMTLKADGSAEAIMGGYTPWLDLYWGDAAGGRFLELPLAIDFMAYYRTLRELADADPDPQTGKNRSISSAFKLEAVPAFSVPATPATTAQAGPNAPVKLAP